MLRSKIDGLLPSYGQTRDFGYPHIKIDSRGDHYIVIERGNEVSHITTPQLDELLYYVFESITSSLASIYAVDHRIKDFRRPMFPHQIELLAKLSPQWAARRSQEHAKILRENPFNDRH
jgi:hypothetical protein